MQLEADGMRTRYCFPDGIGRPEAKSDHPASAMRVIETRGMQGWLSLAGWPRSG
jgi:hypothetical protein